MTIDVSCMNDELLEIVNNTEDIILSYSKLDERSGLDMVKKYSGQFDLIEKNIKEQMLKIAVVGAIKSGKSTFINSFLKSDFLKRGAGVITSVVTRVRRGKSVKAYVSFRNIEEININIRNFVVLIPSFEDGDGMEDFDIRDDSCRKKLSDILDKLNSEQLIEGDSRESKTISLCSCLNGYKRVEPFIEEGLKIFENDDFNEYKDFVSDESLAVYVKDILVEIPETALDENIEIADCQGSDSTNPLHIARIQDYLLKAGFIIYIVSSRTGLRQADIKFLDMLKKMGLTKRSVFIINSDMSEHGDIADLKRVESTTVEELKMIVSDADFFTVSALYELFTENRAFLGEKDRLRLEQWEIDKEIIEYLEKGFSGFRNYFFKEFISKKQFFFYSGIAKKIENIVMDFRERIVIKQNLLETEDKEKALELEAQVKKVREIKELIKNTFEGARRKFDRILKDDVDKFFNSPESIQSDIFGFISNYHPDFKKYVSKNGEFSVKIDYSRLYKDFKQELDNYIAQESHPSIIAFVKEKETEIALHYYELSTFYESMILEAKQNFRKITGVSRKETSQFITSVEDFNEREVELPSAIDSINYNVSIKTVSIATTGFVFLKKFFRKFLKSSSSMEGDSLKASEKILEKIKKEAQKALKDHFLNYRENLKFQYILKSSKEACYFYFSELISKIDFYVSDFSEIIKFTEKEMDIKKKYIEDINSLRGTTDLLLERIEGFLEKVN
ncbi:MAG: hypothetical protein CSA18_04065 [Deltaproteobacteria bacterium]|nr:MAG: hypothetical protein CSA18_04065 [Deltaproteobacteria bacterium]